MASPSRLSRYAGLSGGALLPAFGWGPAALARWQGDWPAIAAGQWWRLFSASWVHVDAQHAALNGAGLLLGWLLCAPPRRRWLWPLALLVTPAGLLLAAGPGWPFAGASGVVYAWLAWAALGWRGGYGWLLLLAARAGWQLASGEAVFAHAHLAGLLLALLCHGLTRRRPWSSGRHALL